MVPLGDRLVVHEFAVVDVDRLSEQRQQDFVVVELAAPPCGLGKNVDVDMRIIGKMQADGGGGGKNDIGEVWLKDLFEAEERYA